MEYFRINISPFWINSFISFLFIHLLLIIKSLTWDKLESEYKIKCKLLWEKFCKYIRSHRGEISKIMTDIWYLTLFYFIPFQQVIELEEGVMGTPNL